jgi:hypothetical protein
MSRRTVAFNEFKETSNNLALLERTGRPVSKKYMNDPRPSATFSSQWTFNRGYNTNPPPNYIATPIINPNEHLMQEEFNEPYVIPRPKGWYSPAGRAATVAGYSENNLASLVPEEHQRGYFAMPEVLPLLEPKATNGAPVPRPRTMARRREEKLRNAANANELLRNINRTVRSRRRKNKTRRNR